MEEETPTCTIGDIPGEVLYYQIAKRYLEVKDWVSFGLTNKTMYSVLLEGKVPKRTLRRRAKQKHTDAEFDTLFSYIAEPNTSSIEYQVWCNRDEILEEILQHEQPEHLDILLKWADCRGSVDLINGIANRDNALWKLVHYRIAQFPSLTQWKMLRKMRRHKTIDNYVIRNVFAEMLIFVDIDLWWFVFFIPLILTLHLLCAWNVGTSSVTLLMGLIFFNMMLPNLLLGLQIFEFVFTLYLGEISYVQLLIAFGISCFITWRNFLV